MTQSTTGKKEEVDVQSLLRKWTHKNESKYADGYWFEENCDVKGMKERLAKAIEKNERNKQFIGGISRFGDKTLSDIYFGWRRRFKGGNSSWNSNCSVKSRTFLQRVSQVGKRDGTWVRINHCAGATDWRGVDFHKVMFTIKGQRINLPSKATKVYRYSFSKNQPLTKEMRDKYPVFKKTHPALLKGDTHNWEHINLDEQSIRYLIGNALEDLVTLGVLEKHCYSDRKLVDYSNHSRNLIFQEIWIDLSQIDYEDGYYNEKLRYEDKTLLELWDSKGEVDILDCARESSWNNYSTKLMSPDRTSRIREEEDSDYIYAVEGYKEDNWFRYGLEAFFWNKKNEDRREKVLAVKSRKDRVKEFLKENIINDYHCFQYVQLRTMEIVGEVDLGTRTTDSLWEEKRELQIYLRFDTSTAGCYATHRQRTVMNIIAKVLDKKCEDWDYEKGEVK